MRAARLHAQGPGATLVVEDVEVPHPGPGQVLVTVEAMGVNFADLMIRYGGYPEPITLPFIPGSEVVGVVAQRHEGVQAPSVGDRVVAHLASGGYAEVAVAEAGRVRVIPAGMDPAVALALQTQGITAYQLLTEASTIRPGDTVLVHAAAGGVGSLAVQIARSLGARVVAAVGSEAKRRVVADLGAELVVDTSAPDWAEVVTAAVGPVDVALDCIGGEVSARSLRMLRPVTGRLVVYGAASGLPPAINALELIGPNTTVTGYSMRPYIDNPVKMGAAIAALSSYVETGALRPVTQHSFALQDADAAQRLVASRASVGKVVIVP